MWRIGEGGVSVEGLGRVGECGGIGEGGVSVEGLGRVG